MATPYRAVALEPGAGLHLVRLDGGQEMRARAVVLATGAEYRRLPIGDGAMVVRFVHERFSTDMVEAAPA
jgi:alkyl hydroperoxide reductase subunit AhpF